VPTARPAGRVRLSGLLFGLASAGLSVLAACTRTPSAVGPPLPLAQPAWLPAVPATHDVLSTVLASMRTYGPNHEWSGARNQLFANYLSAIAQNGPTATPALFPTDDDALAYAIDAHVAWVIALGETPALRSRDVGTLRDAAFPLDGKTATLAQLEDEIAARAPFEPRAALFLNSGWRGGPPLPGAAVEARSLGFQLATQARMCGQAPGFWSLDRAHRSIRVTSFTRFMWGLPTEQPQRTRRLLQLVPPPPDVEAAIFATCGESLLGCSITSTLFDTSRLIEPTPHR
jgi:hypothetical protein